MLFKQFKKLIALVLALSLVVGITACGTSKSNMGQDNKGSKDSNSKQITLTLWDFHTDAEGKFFQEIAKKYSTVNPNVKIQVVDIPFNDYLGTKLSTAFAAGSGPDIFFVSPGTIGKYIDSGIALPLNKYMDDKIKSDFSESSLEGVSVGDKIYALPFEVELLGLYYDEDAFKQAGIEQPPKTWDELKTDALKLKTKTRSGLTIEVSKGAYQNFTWYPFLWMTGSDVFTKDGKDSALGQPGVGEALQFWKDLIQSGAANPKPSRPTNDIGILGDGETAMQICGTWAIPTIEQKYSNKHIGVVPLPIPDGGKAADVAGGWKLMVNAKGKSPEEAAKFVMWAFGGNTDIPLEWCTKVKFAYSPRKSVVEAGKDIYDKGLRKVFTEQMYGTDKPELRMPAEAETIIENMIQDAMFNPDISGESAAKKADSEMKAFLKNYNGTI